MEKTQNLLGIPAGSLLQATADLLLKIGIAVMINGRDFTPRIEGSKIFEKAFITRPDRLPKALMEGYVNAAFVGLDFLIESGLENSVVQIVELNYSKVSRQPARIVVFSKLSEIIDRKDKTFLSEYSVMTKKLYPNSIVVPSTGTTESDVALGIYDYGVGVVDTGKSLEDNGLNILKTIMTSPVILIAKKQTEELEIFGQMLKGALEAEFYQLIKFNANLEDKEKLIKILPALESPTISSLADGAISIETIIPKNIMSDTIVTIKKSGGKDVIVQNINISL